MSKITLEFIKASLPEGWECLSTTYTNLDTTMSFTCNEGHMLLTTWKEIRKDFKCPVCSANINKQIVDIAAKPKTQETRILALDQSSKKTGYAVYDGLDLIAYGVLEVTGDFNARLVEMASRIESLIVAWKPDFLAYEEPQYNANFKQANDYNGEVTHHNVFRMLAMVAGVVVYLGQTHSAYPVGIPIPTWRGGCGVKGRARADVKRSAQLLVKKWHDVSVTDDESDAICIGRFLAQEKQRAKSIKSVSIGEAKKKRY